MSRYWLWLGGVVVVVVAGYFLLFRPTTITNYPSSGTDLIAFGDSLVYGTGASSGNDFVSLVTARVSQPVVNLGHPGDTAADGLARLSDLDAYHPKIVLLLLGGNDYLKRVPREQTFANLAKIIENIQGRGAIVLLLGVRGGVLQDNFAGEYKALSKRYGTAYVSDVLSGLLGDERYMSDQVHPNDAGYAIIANRVAPVLEKLLR